MHVQKRQRSFRCFVIGLLLLNIISIYMLSDVFAQYASKAGGSSTAKVAKFDVIGQVEPVAGENGKFTMTVTNQSEVPVSYKISIVLDAPLKVTLDDQTKTPISGSQTVVFENGWTLDPNGNSDEHMLLLEISDWSYITNDQYGSTAEKTINFTVDITAEQLQEGDA